jgi:hypothetical protein
MLGPLRTIRRVVKVAIQEAGGLLALFLLLSLLLAGYSKQTMSLDDARLQPFSSMYSVPRETYGMTLPKNGKVWIEKHGHFWASKEGYDAMLHISGRAMHYVAFRKQGDSYRWIGEQEVCTGPRKYQSENGLLNEEIEVSVFHGMPGHAEGLWISYRGPDEQLRMAHNLKPADIEPLLQRWGCQ